MEFKNFQAYTQAVHASGQSTIISGVLGPGNFNFTLTVAANGDIVAVGNYGTGTTYTITIPADYALTDGSGLINYNQSSTIYFSPNSAGGFPVWLFRPTPWMRVNWLRFCKTSGWVSTLDSSTAQRLIRRPTCHLDKRVVTNGLQTDNQYALRQASAQSTLLQPIRQAPGRIFELHRIRFSLFG